MGARFCRLLSFETFTRTKSVEDVLADSENDRNTFEIEDYSINNKNAGLDNGSEIGVFPHSANSNKDDEPISSPGGLAKVLGVIDIIAYGIGCTVGAGIFAITGTGAQEAGPAIVLSFVIASVSCMFSAFCYMEFATRVPVAGSAYSFSYVCLGELTAWFVGWNLTLEYAISAAVVARAFSKNFLVLTSQLGLVLPQWVANGYVNDTLSSVNPLAASLCLLCTLILIVGVKESSTLNIIITFTNISVILFIIIYGSFLVDTTNWTKPHPGGNEPSFIPMGFNGVLHGAATVFFSYIGFDSVTTLSEEVSNPKKDMPIGMMVTLLVSTCLYVGVSLVVTGMVPWYDIDLDAPLATAFKTREKQWAATLVSAGTVLGLAGATLTSLFGQPRVFYRMAKDGLLFEPFARVSETSKTPVIGTIISGVVAALISLLIPLDSLTNMISIGTLLAFATVCAGVVVLRYEKPSAATVFEYTVAKSSEYDAGCENSSYNGVVYQKRDGKGNSPSLLSPEQQVHSSSSYQAVRDKRETSFSAIPSSNSFFSSLLCWLHRALGSPIFLLFLFAITSVFLSLELHKETIAWEVVAIWAVGCLACVLRIWWLPVNLANLPSPSQFTCPLVPFMPCMGIFVNVYLICSLDVASYIRVAIWTGIGMAIYFGYGITHSKLSMSVERQKAPAESSASEDAIALSQ